ncbi:MAG: glycoside hydrolase family 16 protein [Pirellulaceae bacterium]|nr:glycoside hydrolase family 16 protein [Pirellulaceae bacterium]MDP7018088.1 glycoside hydrolase family 16 protein [Pirellulaceae bacterium]
MYSLKQYRFLSAALCAVLVFPFLAGSVQAQSAKRRPVWSQEFNGDAIDRSVWTYDTGGHGFGNGQLEFNTDRPDNSYLKDGKLVIEARRERFEGREFTSARMHTQGRFAFQYGTLEARIQVPDTANGVWPAFWMLGDNFPAVAWPKCGEVDILEIGGKDAIRQGLQHRQINCALHFAGKSERKTSLVEWHNANADLHKDFHTYKLEWTPKSIRFFLDDREFGGWDISAPEFREYHQPFFPILNVAVGSWTSSYTAIDTPDKVTARFPARMQVDWVRLYANSHTKVLLKRKAAPAGGYGVFTEHTQVANRLRYSDGKGKDFAYSNRAALFLWHNLKSAAQPAPREGSECWSFEAAAGQWFGFGVLTPRHRNMESYGKGALTFAVKSRSPAHMKVGIKSSKGEVWMPLGDEEDEFGFARDGDWHRVRIPLSRLKTDLRTVQQLFMFAGDAPDATVRVAIDDVRWETGTARE